MTVYGRTSERLPLEAFIGPVVLVALSIAVGVAVSSVRLSLNVVLIASIAVVSTLPLILRVSARRADLFEPLTIFTVSWLAMFVVRPAVMLGFGDFTYLGYDARAGFTQMLWMALLGALGFSLGYSWRFASRIARAIVSPPTVTDDEAVVMYAFVAAAFGLLVFGAFVMRSGGLGFLTALLNGRTAGQAAAYHSSTAYLYSSLFVTFPSGLLLLDVAWRRRDRVLGVAGVCVMSPALVVSGASGTRSWLLPMVGGLVMLPYLHRNQRPRAATIAIFAFLVLAVGIAFVRAERDVRLRAGKSTQQTLISNLLRPQDAIRSLFETGDTEMAPLLAITASYVPSRYAYRNGSASGEIFVHWVPRLLWPKKPRSGDEELTQRMFVSTRVSAAPRQYSPLANFYLDFGLAGCLIGMALIGLIGRVHFDYFRLNEENPGVRVLYAATLPFWVVLMRGSVTDTAGRMLFVVPPLLVGLFLSHRGRLQRGTSCV